MIKRDGWHLRVCCSWIFGLALMMWAGSASAKWYMVVGTLPNLVQVVDTTTDKVVRTIPLEGHRAHPADFHQSGHADALPM